MDHFASLFMVSPLLLGVLFFVAMLAGFIILWPEAVVYSPSRH